MPARRLLPIRPKTAAPDISFAIVSVAMLLILFFLASGAMTDTPPQGVTLAQSRDLPMVRLPRPFLTVMPNGDVLLDDVAVQPEDLAEALADQGVVHVLINGEAPGRDLIALLLRAQLDGITVKLVTMQRQGAE